jgi:hypothetical protein
MEDITLSPQKFLLTKDIKKILTKIEPIMKHNTDVSSILLKLYEEEFGKV